MFKILRPVAIGRVNREFAKCPESYRPCFLTAKLRWFPDSRLGTQFEKLPLRDSHAVLRSLSFSDKTPKREFGSPRKECPSGSNHRFTRTAMSSARIASAIRSRNASGKAESRGACSCIEGRARP